MSRLLGPMGMALYFTVVEPKPFVVAVDYEAIMRELGIRIASYEAEEVRFFQTVEQCRKYLQQKFYPRVVDVDRWIFRSTVIIAEGDGWQYCREPIT